MIACWAVGNSYEPKVHAIPATDTADPALLRVRAVCGTYRNAPWRAVFEVPPSWLDVCRTCRRRTGYEPRLRPHTSRLHEAPPLHVGRRLHEAPPRLLDVWPGVGIVGAEDT